MQVGSMGSNRLSLAENLRRLLLIILFIKLLILKIIPGTDVLCFNFCMHPTLKGIYTLLVLLKRYFIQN